MVKINPHTSTWHRAWRMYAPDMKFERFRGPGQCPRCGHFEYFHALQFVLLDGIDEGDPPILTVKRVWCGHLGCADTFIEPYPDPADREPVLPAGMSQCYERPGAGWLDNQGI